MYGGGDEGYVRMNVMDERPRAEIYGSISIFRAAGAGRG